MEPREGHGGRSQETGDRKAFEPRSPTGFCSISILNFTVLRKTFLEKAEGKNYPDKVDQWMSGKSLVLIKLRATK